LLQNSQRRGTIVALRLCFLALPQATTSRRLRTTYIAHLIPLEGHRGGGEHHVNTGVNEEHEVGRVNRSRGLDQGISGDGERLGSATWEWVSKQHACVQSGTYGVFSFSTGIRPNNNARSFCRGELERTPPGPNKPNKPRKIHMLSCAQVGRP